MSLHYKIRLIAGSFVLASLALAWLVHPAWLLFTAFVGVNLIQSAFTRWCLMEKILVRTGIHEPARAPSRPSYMPRPRRQPTAIVKSGEASEKPTPTISESEPASPVR